MATRTWHCGNGHRFTYGDEDWHYEDPQFLLEDGSPVPRYCPEEFDSTDYSDKPWMWGEPCMDSSSLIHD